MKTIFLLKENLTEISCCDSKNCSNKAFYSFIYEVEHEDDENYICKECLTKMKNSYIIEICY